MVKTQVVSMLFTIPWTSGGTARLSISVIVGDSIVGALGPNANTLRLELIKRYPDSEFVIYNYGYGATNILSLIDRLTKTTINAGQEYLSILSQGFELIIIESFGYNPLSELSLSEGLAKQTHVLEESTQLILQKKARRCPCFYDTNCNERDRFCQRNI